MSDDADDVTQDAPAADPAPTRAPSPGALAASRARRIGGRPAPGPRPGPAPGPRSTSAPTSTSEREPGSGSQPSSDLAAKPAGGKAGAGRAQGAGQVSVATLGRVFAAIAGVAAVLLIATTAWLSHGVWWDKPDASQSQTQQVREKVLAAATTCLSAVTNYDYRSIPAAEKAGVACSTGAFQAAYKKAMQTTVTTYAPQTKTAQTFQANKAGIISVSPDGAQWVVLLYGQQAVTNTSHAAASPELDVLSARVTLNKVGGKWLISALAQA
jgi:hypothetical protein